VENSRNSQPQAAVDAQTIQKFLALKLLFLSFFSVKKCIYFLIAAALQRRSSAQMSLMLLIFIKVRTLI
jgi:hypothetical protein